MSSKKSIVWLASYPKSGNTWTRVFLANYLMNGDTPVPINQVHRFGMGDSIPKMYQMVGGENFDLMNIEVSVALRPKVLRGIVANNADVNFVKTHNSRGSIFGVDMIPSAMTRSAIYIMRNPLDTVLSYSKHFGQTIEEATDSICRSDNVNGPEATSVIQFLGSWSDHVRSWTSVPEFPVCVVRYEDLLKDPETEFTKILKLIGMPVDAERLKKAIRFSSFKELSAQEAEHGFTEKPKTASKFFNSGQSGQWRKKLPKKLATRIIKVNRELMEKYGYLE